MSEPATAPAAARQIVFGMLHVHLRGGGTVEIPLREETANITALMAVLVQDIETEATRTGSLVRDGLFQIRPGLWLRCGQVVALAFSPTGHE